MGNKSSSEATQIINQKIINKNDLESINQHATDSATEAIMKSAQDAQASSSKIAEVNIGEITATGPGSVVGGINVLIDQESFISLEVIAESVQKNDINTELALAIVNDVSSKINNEQMAKLVSSAESDQSVSGLALTGGNSSSAKVYNRMDSTTMNETKRKFTNIVSNKISQKTNTEDTKSCIAADLQSAKININRIAASNGGTIENINLTIKQASNLVNKCIMQSVQNSAVTTSIATSLGLKVTDETTNKQTSEGEAKAVSTQKITGIFDMASLIVIAVIIALAIVAKIAMGGKKSKGDE